MEGWIHSLRMGWRNFFPVVVCHYVFLLLRREKFLVAQVSFLVVAGNSLRCYLLTYHNSCAVVSVFGLRREIVFGCTVCKKDSYSLSLKERESASKCVYFVRSHTLLLCNSLLCIYLLYRTDPHTAYLFLALYGSTTLQSLSFLKNIENFRSK